MDIRILPSNIANMIAAGEVVQRPASVVKELMENALDAGASKVDVIVLDAGRTLIQVIDNGCGMTPDQAVLCFQRHATSKIMSAADLQKIETFGFRGEALASIAAVAEVTLKTRTSDAEVATKVTITDATAEDPGRQDVSETAAPVGANFEIRNLFYNTPARRKFLKSDAAEMKQIISEFIKLALAATDISFSLVSNGREVYRLQPAKTLKYRIQNIFSEALVSSLLPIEVQTSFVSVTGFISRPDDVRKTVSNQYFFVNGRYFRSSYLHKAVMAAYENIISEGLTPSYFIFLELNPSAMDVNVHPTKTEIKFEDDSLLFNVLMAAVRETLGRSAFSARLDFDRADIPEVHTVSGSFEEYHPSGEPSIVEDPGFNPFESDGYPNRREWKECSPLFEDLPVRQVNTATQMQKMLILGKYLLCNGSSGVLLVDSSRAMHRILYENFLDAISRDLPLSQSSLFPVEVEVGAENFPVLEQNADLLRRMGFDFSFFSNTSIVVNGIPEGVTDNKMAVSALFFELITALNDERVSIAGAVYGGLAEKMAKSAARSAKMPVNEEEAHKLMERLYACENPDFTSDGHRIVAVLKPDDLENLLK